VRNAADDICPACVSLERDERAADAGVCRILERGCFQPSGDLVDTQGVARHSAFVAASKWIRVPGTLMRLVLSATLDF
jgi:hypothetical protein